MGSKFSINIMPHTGLVEVMKNNEHIELVQENINGITDIINGITESYENNPQICPRIKIVKNDENITIHVNGMDCDMNDSHLILTLEESKEIVAFSEDKNIANEEDFL